MGKGEMRRHPWEDPENMRFGLRTLGLGAGLCCGMCGQLLFHTPSAGVGQDGCSIDKIHFSTSHTLTFISLSPTN